MNILVIDAYDSFVHTIALYLKRLKCRPIVHRSDQVTVDGIREMAPDAILLGPGPGHPADVGYVSIVRALSSTIPTLGVCLGHQAIALAYGGDVDRATHLVHGKTSRINHTAEGVFTEMPNGFRATRYHSLIVTRSSLPAELRVTATSEDDGYVMGLRHLTHPVESVQFHPESITTEGGAQIFNAFLDHALAWSKKSCPAPQRASSDRHPAPVDQRQRLGGHAPRNGRWVGLEGGIGARYSGGSMG